MAEPTPERTITEALSVANSRRLREVAIPCGFKAVNVEGDKIEMVAQSPDKRLIFDFGSDANKIESIRLMELKTGLELPSLTRGGSLDHWLNLLKEVGIRNAREVHGNVIIEPPPGEAPRVHPKGFDVAFSGTEKNFQPREVRIIEIG